MVDNDDPVRIIGGRRIMFGQRSAADAIMWVCSCGESNWPEKKLIFTLPAFRCKKCAKQFDGVLDFCLANVKANGIPLVGLIKQQDPGELECITYAIAYKVEIMHNTERACRSTTPVSLKSSRMTTYFHTLWYNVKYAGVKNGGHKLLHLCQKIRKEGVHFECGEHYQVGKTRVIHPDNFEEICRLIADGIPVLAPLTTGYKYPDLQYCQLYKAVSRDEPELQRAFKQEVEGGHMLCLIGALQSKDGQRGFYALDAAGELFCAQLVSGVDGTGEPTGGFGKLNADSEFIMNFLAFARKEDCKDDEKDEIELIDEQEDATEVSRANKEVMAHGEFFKKQNAALKEKLLRIWPWALDE